MIVLDTHVWAWWVEEPERLSNMQIAAISDQENDDNGIGICSTSIWEIAKIVELGGIQLNVELSQWFENRVIAYPGITYSSTSLRPSRSSQPGCREIFTETRQTRLLLPLPV